MKRSALIISISIFLSLISLNASSACVATNIVTVVINSPNTFKVQQSPSNLACSSTPTNAGKGSPVTAINCQVCISYPTVSKNTVVIQYGNAGQNQCAIHFGFNDNMKPTASLSDTCQNVNLQLTNVSKTGDNVTTNYTATITLPTSSVMP